MKRIEITADMKVSGLKAVFSILDKWECTIQEQTVILGIPSSSYQEFRKVSVAPDLNPTQLERISLILNIHASLQSLFENPDNVYGFMRMPNKNAPFNGNAPLTYISDGRLSSLRDTMQHLSSIQANP
jgi:hypothetical protein